MPVGRVMLMRAIVDMELLQPTHSAAWELSWPADINSLCMAAMITPTANAGSNGPKRGREDARALV